MTDATGNAGSPGDAAVPSKALTRCLSGELPPAVALMHLLIETGSADEARDRLTAARAWAEANPRHDLAAVGQLRRLERLLRENQQGVRQIAAMLRDGIDHERRAASPEAGIAACRALFDRLVRQQPELSVALYSLGNPDILNAVTAEIVAKMRAWNLLGADRELLELGCGIGRFESALAGEVKAITGIDVSGSMIEAARRRCAGLSNVRLLECSGRDLSLFDDGAFDLVFAVDSFPYIIQSDLALAERHVHEAARVLKPRGDLLILNFSYRSDIEADRRDLARFAATTGFEMVRNGTQELALWDGLAFQLRRPD